MKTGQTYDEVYVAVESVLARIKSEQDPTPLNEYRQLKSATTQMAIYHVMRRGISVEDEAKLRRVVEGADRRVIRAAVNVTPAENGKINRDENLSPIMRTRLRDFSNGILQLQMDMTRSWTASELRALKVHLAAPRKPFERPFGEDGITKGEVSKKVYQFKLDLWARLITGAVGYPVAAYWKEVWDDMQLPTEKSLANLLILGLPWEFGEAN